jgi:hypothetical protein
MTYIAADDLADGVAKVSYETTPKWLLQRDVSE